MKEITTTTIKIYKEKNLCEAKKKLQWLPTYNISDSVKVTTEWYHRVLEKKEDPITVTDFQIEDYMHENNWS